METSRVRKVRREHILDLAAYEAERPHSRQQAFAAKSRRRVHLGDHLTFLFENFVTIRYQIQEMLRSEGRSSEQDIEHEIATYNELLGEPGELGCTLLIEIEDPVERDRKLREWLALPEHVYLELAGGDIARAVYDPRQVGADRLSSVQYLKFHCGGSVPVAIGCDLPGMLLSNALTPAQRGALAEDLAASAED